MRHVLAAEDSVQISPRLACVPLPVLQKKTFTQLWDRVVRPQNVHSVTNKRKNAINTYKPKVFYVKLVSALDVDDVAVTSSQSLMAAEVVDGRPCRALSFRIIRQEGAATSVPVRLVLVCSHTWYVGTPLASPINSRFVFLSRRL